MSDDPENHGLIVGTVYSASTGQPLAGVRVTLDNVGDPGAGTRLALWDRDGKDAWITGTTDAHGRYGIHFRWDETQAGEMATAEVIAARLWVNVEDNSAAGGAGASKATHFNGRLALVVDLGAIVGEHKLPPDTAEDWFELVKEAAEAAEEIEVPGISDLRPSTELYGLLGLGEDVQADDTFTDGSSSG